MTAMAMLELKQKVFSLSTGERREISSYLQRLKHESAAGRRELSRTMKEMDAGKKTSLKLLAQQLGYA